MKGIVLTRAASDEEENPAHRNGLKKLPPLFHRQPSLLNLSRPYLSSFVSLDITLTQREPLIE